MSEAVAFFAFIPRVRKCRLLNNPSWHQHCLRHSSVSVVAISAQLTAILDRTQSPANSSARATDVLRNEGSPDVNTISVSSDGCWQAAFAWWIRHGWPSFLVSVLEVNRFRQAKFHCSRVLAGVARLTFWGSALAERLWGITVHNHRCRILFRIGCPSVSFRRRMTFERFFSRGRQSKLNCNHWHGPTAESIALDNDVVSGLLTEALFGTFCVRYRGTGYTLLLYSRHSTE